VVAAGKEYLTSKEYLASKEYLTSAWQVVLLKNMVDVDDVDEQLEEEITGVCVCMCSVCCIISQQPGTL